MLVAAVAPHTMAEQQGQAVEVVVVLVRRMVVAEQLVHKIPVVVVVVALELIQVVARAAQV
jgi:hypothetical protein